MIKKIQFFFIKAKIAFNFGFRKIVPIKNVYDVDQFSNKILAD